MSTPKMITRPLCLIDGRVYAAIWPWASVPTTDKNGQIIQVEERRLHIVRDDGVLFGDGGAYSLQALELTIQLHDTPPDACLWSLEGVQHYLQGVRPAATDVFESLVAHVDALFDFDRSLADQRTMCEMIACYIMSTWFIDAFDVVGYLWPNGEWGSGKTKLLATIVEWAYLGCLITASGTFAAIRDMAGYQATIAFDDAEIFADPKRSDGDKRALFLAGNRRGVTIPLKEPTLDKQFPWKTRHVNAFCNRLFSATQLPDAILASRTIIVPLVKTPDEKANRELHELTDWASIRQHLLDDLWALALAHLPTVKGYVPQVRQATSLRGRALEPWLALLTTARWLDAQGVSGVWERMEALAQHYQEERRDLEPLKLETWAIAALCYAAPIWATWATSATCATSPGEVQEWVFTAGNVIYWMGEYRKECHPDIHAIGVISEDTVGKALGTLRLRKKPRPGGLGPRRWCLTLDELQRMAQAHNIQLLAVVPHIDEPLADPLYGSGPGGSGGSGGSLRPLPDDFDIYVDWDEIPDEWEGVGSHDSLWEMFHN